MEKQRYPVCLTHLYAQYTIKSDELQRATEALWCENGGFCFHTAEVLGFKIPGAVGALALRVDLSLFVVGVVTVRTNRAAGEYPDGF
jgi:hypothetical protein